MGGSEYASGRRRDGTSHTRDGPSDLDHPGACPSGEDKCSSCYEAFSPDPFLIKTDRGCIVVRAAGGLYRRRWERSGKRRRRAWPGRGRRRARPAPRAALEGRTQSFHNWRAAHGVRIIRRRRAVCVASAIGRRSAQAKEWISSYISLAAREPLYGSSRSMPASRSSRFLIQEI